MIHIKKFLGFGSENKNGLIGQALDREDFVQLMVFVGATTEQLEKMETLSLLW